MALRFAAAILEPTSDSKAIGTGGGGGATLENGGSRAPLSPPRILRKKSVEAYIKGIVSREECFFECPKIQTVFFNELFTIFICLFVKEIQNEVSACFYEITF